MTLYRSTVKRKATYAKTAIAATVEIYFAGSQGPVRTVRLRWSISGFSNPA
jgi:hypothetical protein